MTRTTTLIATGLTTLALSACGTAATTPSSSSPVKPAAPAVTFAGGQSAQTVRTWSAKWCQAKPGMTKDQLYTLMGQPTADLTQNTTYPQASWAAAEYRFNAFFGVDGKVRQLDIIETSLSRSEISHLGCSDIRTAS